MVDDNVQLELRLLAELHSVLGGTISEGIALRRPITMEIYAGDPLDPKTDEPYPDDSHQPTFPLGVCGVCSGTGYQTISARDLGEIESPPDIDRLAKYLDISADEAIKVWVELFKVPGAKRSQGNIYELPCSNCSKYRESTVSSIDWAISELTSREQIKALREKIKNPPPIWTIYYRLYEGDEIKEVTTPLLVKKEDKSEFINKYRINHPHASDRNIEAAWNTYTREQIEQAAIEFIRSTYKSKNVEIVELLANKGKISHGSKYIKELRAELQEKLEFAATNARHMPAGTGIIFKPLPRTEGSYVVVYGTQDAMTTGISAVGLDMVKVWEAPDGQLTTLDNPHKIPIIYSGRIENETFDDGDSGIINMIVKKKQKGSMPVKLPDDDDEESEEGGSEGYKVTIDKSTNVVRDGDELIIHRQYDTMTDWVDPRNQGKVGIPSGGKTPWQEFIDWFDEASGALKDDNFQVGRPLEGELGFPSSNDMRAYNTINRVANALGIDSQNLIRHINRQSKSGEKSNLHVLQFRADQPIPKLEPGQVPVIKVIQKADMPGGPNVEMEQFTTPIQRKNGVYWTLGKGLVPGYATYPITKGDIIAIGVRQPGAKKAEFFAEGTLVDDPAILDGHAYERGKYGNNLPTTLIDKGFKKRYKVYGTDIHNNDITDTFSAKDFEDAKIDFYNKYPGSVVKKANEITPRKVTYAGGYHRGYAKAVVFETTKLGDTHREVRAKFAYMLKKMVTSRPPPEGFRITKVESGWSVTLPISEVTLTPPISSKELEHEKVPEANRRPDVADHVKTCPQCEGKGCDICDYRGWISPEYVTAAVKRRVGEEDKEFGKFELDTKELDKAFKNRDDTKFIVGEIYGVLKTKFDSMTKNLPPGHPSIQQIARTIVPADTSNLSMYDYHVRQAWPTMDKIQQLKEASTGLKKRLLGRAFDYFNYVLKQTEIRIRAASTPTDDQLEVREHKEDIINVINSHIHRITKEYKDLAGTYGAGLIDYKVRDVIINGINLILNILSEKIPSGRRIFDIDTVINDIDNYGKEFLEQYLGLEITYTGPGKKAVDPDQIKQLKAQAEAVKMPLSRYMILKKYTKQIRCKNLELINYIQYKPYFRQVNSTHGFTYPVAGHTALPSSSEVNKSNLQWLKQREARTDPSKTKSMNEFTRALGLSILYDFDVDARRAASEIEGQ